MKNNIDINEPIITSFLDDDLYKITMGSVVFHTFPRAYVIYNLYNRVKVPFPPGFEAALRRQINYVSNLRMTPEEANWLRTISYIRPTYISWLENYQMNPDEVITSQMGDYLHVEIEGPWYRTIFWEVKLMAIISELYYRMTNQSPDDKWIERIKNKAEKLSNAECHWIDFGTRRRYSLAVQQKLVEIMKNYKGFLGTSNPYLAFKFGVTPHGTYAHECIMAMSALYGPRMADKMWRKHWVDHYQGNVGVALTDTFTSKIFWNDFDSYDARLFDGCRQDSGNEYTWGTDMIDHYRRLGIPVSNKRMIFSNNLDTDKYISIDRYFRKYAQPCGGIGTHFTNDVGVNPLNIVIKMNRANFGIGWLPVTKLTDDVTKQLAYPEFIDLIKKQLNMV
jgi:nicotinate phosphoribosyltransferase